MLGLAACEDGPTAPSVYTHPADGQVWAAVVVPQGMPDLRTWMPYLRAPRNGGEAALREIRTLRAEADRLRRTGNLEEAREREEAAILAAVRGLNQTPSPLVLLSSLAALETWSERAWNALGMGEFSDLAASEREVRALRADAVQALEQGDTSAAVLRIASAAAVVREHAPDAVAGKVLLRAENRLLQQAADDEDAARALRLIYYAREALAAGDPARAFRRALYALQLAEQRNAAVSRSPVEAH